MDMVGSAHLKDNPVVITRRFVTDPVMSSNLYYKLTVLSNSSDLENTRKDRAMELSAQGKVLLRS